MEQKPTIDSIKKCKQDSDSLSLQKTDKALGVEENRCSTFLSRSGLLAQGERECKKQKERNAVVIFRNPATGKLRGKDFSICKVFVAAFFIFFSLKP